MAKKQQKQTTENKEQVITWDWKRPDDGKKAKDMEQKAEKAVSLARLRLLAGGGTKVNTFFATLAMQLHPTVMWECATGATDGKHLFFNPGFILHHTPEEVVGFVCHEVLHCESKHFARRGARDMYLANVAADLAINHLLKEAGFTLPDSGCMPGEGIFKDMKPGLSFEEYYPLVQQLIKVVNIMFVDGDGNPITDPGQCGGFIEPRKVNDDGTTSPLTEEEMDALGREWNVRVASAAMMASRRQGNMPGGLQRLIDEILEPKVDWKHVLRIFVNQPAKDDYSWKRPNRRMMPSGLYLPCRYSTKIGRAVAVIDTSGSISDEVMKQWWGEVMDIASIGVNELIVLYHHTHVYQSQVWHPEEGELLPLAAQSGGTSHHDVFDWVEKNCPQPPDVMVCLTDLQSDFPKNAPQYPVLWCSIDPRSPHPWGDRVDITL